MSSGLGVALVAWIHSRPRCFVDQVRPSMRLMPVTATKGSTLASGTNV